MQLKFFISERLRHALQISLSICSNCDVVLFPKYLFIVLSNIVSTHLTFMTLIHHSIINAFLHSSKCLLPYHWFRIHLLMWMYHLPSRLSPSRKIHFFSPVPQLRPFLIWNNVLIDPF